VNDEDAKRLLELLRDYYRAYSNDADPPEQMTVSQLAIDLQQTVDPVEGVGILGI